MIKGNAKKSMYTSTQSEGLTKRLLSVMTCCIATEIASDGLKQF